MTIGALQMTAAGVEADAAAPTPAMCRLEEALVHNQLALS
jgi:hypothetical protein